VSVVADPPDPGKDGWLSVDLLEPFADSPGRLLVSR
jgi:hypothetical protein